MMMAEEFEYCSYYAVYENKHIKSLTILFHIIVLLSLGIYETDSACFDDKKI